MSTPGNLAVARMILLDMPGRAVAAARIAALRLGIDAPDAYPMRVSFSVYVHLAPAPIVARVAVLTPLLRHPIEDWLARELAVAGALDGLGVPVVRPADPSVHTVDGLRLSLWELADHDRDAEPTPAQAGRSLADLHEAMRLIPPGLIEQRIPALDDLLASGLPVDEVDSIARDLPDRPVQVLHGDAHPGNMLLTDRGWVWHDFEETCLGPVEWDLATMTRSRRLDGREALHHYPGAPPYDDLLPWVELRRRQVPMWDELNDLLPPR
jgi:Phosphotransferase enzyme family